MERIKFHIKRTGWGLFWYLFLNELFPIGIAIMGATSAIINQSIGIFIFVIIIIFPLFLWLWRRSTVVIIGDKMVVRFGIIYFHVVVDISSVSNVHYKQKKEDILGGLISIKIPFQNSKELNRSGANIPFQKPEETVCFTSARGNHYYLAVKEHKKFYELLKKREVYPEAE